MGEEVKFTITADDQASKILVGIGKAFTGISGAVKDVTSKYIEYGAKVQTLSLFAGTSNEQTSRLIQLSDDAFVSIDTLQQSMKQMADKGLQPSVENMAKLSDKFNKIKDPAEQSKFLIDNFSRAGVEMAKVMDLGGKKILEMNKNIADGLIIDDEKQARIQKTKKAIDDFNDSMDAIKYDVADKLLEIFGDMPQPLKDATAALGVLLSPTNINSLVQFGILLKGADMSKLGDAALAAAPKLVTFAGSAWTVVAPAAAAAAAVLALVEVFRMDEFKKVAALLAGGAVGALTNSDVNRGLATQKTYEALGGGSSNGFINDNGSTGQTIRDLLGMAQTAQQQPAPFIYAPVISTASRQEAVEALRPFVNAVTRTNSGR